MSNTLSILSHTRYTRSDTVRYVEGKSAVSTLASFLRSELERRGWSQNQLANKAGVRESTVSNILNKPGGVRSKPQTLRKLAAALEIPESDLTEHIGYSIEGASTPDDRHLRMARLIDSLPWLAMGVEKWLQLPANEQEEILELIEFRLSRHSQKGRNSRRSKQATSDIDQSEA